MYDIVNKSAYKIMPDPMSSYTGNNESERRVEQIRRYDIRYCRCQPRLRGESPADRAMLGENKIPHPAFSKSHPVPRTRGIILGCTLLVAANSLAWIWALAAFADQRTLLGAAILAYTFGLRHGIDGEHIMRRARCRRQQSA